MNKVRVFVSVFPAIAMLLGLCLAGQPAIAQNSTPNNDATTQKHDQTPDSQTSASASKTFTGTISQAGNKFVLSDQDSKATYQLDDQEKAKSFVNKNVKVTGVLDASTGTIRVSEIEQLVP